MHHTKYLHLEEYISSTSKLNRIDHFKYKTALKKKSSIKSFFTTYHDNEFTLYFIKVALSLVFGLKLFTKTRTKLFALFLLSQFSISCCLFKTINQNELHKSLKVYCKGDFFIIESVKINGNISIIRQEMNLNLLTLREWNYKDHTEFCRLILLLSGDINLQLGLLKFRKPGQFSENEDFTLFI